MRRLLYLGVASILVLTLSGCGGDSRSDFVAEIFSDQQADGDIAFNPVSNSFTVTNGPDTILFGIDESNLDLPEFRAFLDFPLDGSTNQDVVPAGAEILSATLEVFVNEVSFAGTVPTLLDLVPFSVNGLTPADWRRKGAGCSTSRFVFCSTSFRTPSDLWESRTCQTSR
jgi:hypothetical protein